jgi:hypothetical protein
VGVQVVDLSNPSAPVKLAPITPASLGLGSDDVSHVIVKGNVLAVSLIASPDKTLPGKVAFFDAAGPYQAQQGFVGGIGIVVAVKPPTQLAATTETTPATTG